MAELISVIWMGLRDAGLPEVMLYLPDGTASRCHWNDTAIVGEVRVALLGDQERKIVRIVPVDACVGIGIASPKGIDPMGYRAFVKEKLEEQAERALAEAAAAADLPEDLDLPEDAEYPGSYEYPEDEEEAEAAGKAY
jgi:hypothetical protein